MSRHTAQGDWKRLTGNEIRDKQIGIVGLGRIGKAVVERAVPFGMKCCAYDVFWDEKFANKHGVVRCESLDELFRTSDVVSLHCFLDESTEDLINTQTISKMKDGVIIINCARGEIVNSADMAVALGSGKVGGYGTDVLDQEPPPADHVLLSAPNTIITSHIGSRTYESVQRQAEMATQNLIRFVNGEPPLAQANELKGSTEEVNKTTSNPDVESFYVVPGEDHFRLVEAAYRHRGYTAVEAQAAARFL